MTSWCDAVVGTLLPRWRVQVTISRRPARDLVRWLLIVRGADSVVRASLQPKQSTKLRKVPIQRFPYDAGSIRWSSCEVTLRAPLMLRQGTSEGLPPSCEFVKSAVPPLGYVRRVAATHRY